MPGWDETDSAIRYRIRDPADFLPESFRTKVLSSGVHLILGRLRRDNTVWDVQALRFPKPVWDLVRAQAWRAQHDFREVVMDEALLAQIQPGSGTTSAQADVVVEMGESRLDLHKAQEARAKEYGIPVLAESSHLTPPAGYPEDPDQYADPVNFKYRLDDKAHADNARARFAQAHGVYDDKVKRFILSRIVDAQLKFKSSPSFDPENALDKLLPAEMKRRLMKMGETEPDMLARIMHQMLASGRLAEADREFVEECLKESGEDKLPTKDKVQRLQGLAASMGMGWPSISHPVGAPDECDMTSALGTFVPAREYRAGGPLLAQMGDQLVTLSFRDIADASTFTVPNVEIFATGTWKGEEWTRADLEEVVRNFKALGNRVRVPVKVGHHHSLLMDHVNDSLPAMGWVTDLRLKDTLSVPKTTILVADLAYVPRIMRDLIHQRAYSRVSAEIYEGFADANEGREYGKVLKAVALLGSAMPEVKTLQDVTLLYREAPLAHSASKTVRFVEYPTDGGNEVTPEELVQLQQQLEDEKKARVAVEARLAEAQRARRNSETTAFFAEYATKGILVPAQQDSVAKIMAVLYAVDDQTDPNQVKLFSEASGGTVAVGLFRAFVASIKVPQVPMGESMPQGAPRQDGLAPGAPHPGPLTQQPAPAAKVKVYTDTRGREFPIMGDTLLAQAQAYRAQHPTTIVAGMPRPTTLEDAVAALQLSGSQEVI